MKRIKIKIDDLFKRLNLQFDSNEEKSFINNENIKIKNHENKFVKINEFVIKKTNSFKIIFENDIKLICSDQHIIMTNNGEKKINEIDLKNDKIISKYGLLKIKSITSEKENDILYDFCLDDPHLFKDENGFIHHNSLSITYIYKHLLENKLIQKPLLIVPRIDLVRQFKNDMLEYGIDENLIGCVWGEEKEFDKPITISTWQSLIFIEDRFKNELLENSGIDSHQQKSQGNSLKEKRRILKNFESPFTRYDSVAIDEVHKSGTDNKLHWILQQCVNATWRFGFTGTLPDGNLSLWNVKSYLGPVVCSYKTEELRQKGYIANCKVHFTNIHYKKKEFEGQEINKENIFKLPKRINIIKNIIKKVPNKPIVLLVDSIQKDGKFLENVLKQDIELFDREIVFIRGSVKVSEREKWYEKCRNGENVILIAMFQILQEGLTIPCLSDLIFASPCSSKIRVLQSIGRTLGTHYSKVNANIYDLVDHTTGYIGGKKSGATRFKYYMKEKFEVVETEI